MQIPTDSRRELFAAATEKLSRQREALGITEEQIAADIKDLHSQRRVARLADVNHGLSGSERNS